MAAREREAVSEVEGDGQGEPEGASAGCGGGGGGRARALGGGGGWHETELERLLGSGERFLMLRLLLGGERASCSSSGCEITAMIIILNISLSAAAAAAAARQVTCFSAGSSNTGNRIYKVFSSSKTTQNVHLGVF